MAKTPKQRSFQQVVELLGDQRFDVAGAREGSAPPPAALQVSKHGCAARIRQAPDGGVELVAKPGWLLNGEISRLVDKGYQKFLQTAHLEVPATAEILRAIHDFTEQLHALMGAGSLYNESLGTTSDRYVYDRVAGR